MAFAAVGRGPYLLVDFGWLSHFGQAWEFAPYRAFIERLAGHRTVVLHDKPGFGASSGEPPSLTLSGATSSIESLADHLGLRSFDMLAALQAGPMAVAYAAAHPGRVGRLILYGTYADGRGMGEERLQASLVSLIRAHWGVGSSTLAGLWMPDGDPAAAGWFARYQRQAAGSELAAEAISACYSYDVRAAAGAIRRPVLVVHRRGDRAVPMRLGRELADLIPGSTFLAVEGRSHVPFVGDSESVLEPVLRFLGVGGAAIAATGPPRLSPREMEVAALIAQGRTNAEIAASLAIGQRTAEAHAENIRHKLGFRTRAQIAAWTSTHPPT